MPDDDLWLPDDGSDMPDCCDHCTESHIYYPVAWVEGMGVYVCRGGHAWTCGWGRGDSGINLASAYVNQI